MWHSRNTRNVPIKLTWLGLMMKKFVFLLFLLISFSAKADILVKDTKEGSPSEYSMEIEISGEIKKKDVKTLNEALKAFTPDQIFIRVTPNSNGGDLNTAMEIGRILRKYNALSIMMEENQCHSACVFIIAGAPQRLILGGKVGIHRPYLYQDNETTEKGQKKQKSKLDNLAIKYLKEMNVSETLYTDMVRISPQNIKILSKDELLKYGLGSDDPYFEDAENAKLAKNLGIPSAELIKRKSAFKTICIGDVKEIAKCYKEVVEKGNLSYQPENKVSGATESNTKNELISKLDKLRPNWREITNSKEFKEWTITLSESERTKFNDSWDPYYLNEKIQQFIDQKGLHKPSDTSIRLSCFVNKNDLILEVNFEKSTVNGYSAKINDSYIRYVRTGTDMTIIRATGAIRVDYVPPYSRRGIPLLPDFGQCKRVGENSF